MGFENRFMLDLRPSWVNKTQAANWEAAVRRIIIKMANVQSGRVLLNSLKWHNKWIPITHYDHTWGKCNAVADEPAKVTARDGRAYAADVFFSPHIFTPHYGCTSTDPNQNRGNRPDEVLFHELVHALRRASGKRARADTSGGLIYYDTNEEFNAILATNIYVTDPSNKRSTGLRADHQDGKALAAALATSLDFFASSGDTFDMVSKFCSDNPGFTGALARVNSSFNPLTVFFNDPAAARAKSRSATATIRDAAGWGVAAGRFLKRLLGV